MVRKTASEHQLTQLFGTGGYIALPNFILQPAVVQAIGFEGVGYLACLAKAYDNGQRRHRLTNGRFALSDEDLMEWAGLTTAKQIRRLKDLVHKALPSVLEIPRAGNTGRPTEYEFFRLSAHQQVKEWPLCTIGLAPRVSRARVGPCEALSRQYDVRDEALRLAQAGRSVLLLRPRTKQPGHAWRKWQKTRMTVGEIQEAFTKNHGANLGVVTGQISNLVVLDLDGDHDAALRALEEQVGPLPTTTVVKTGRGRHLWFAHPGVAVPSKNGLLRGETYAVDVRAEGGLVVVPPSIHSSGVNYQYETELDELPQLPPALQELITESEHAGYDIAQLKQSNNLVEVMRECGVELVPAEQDEWNGLCPFHPDQQPSLSANSQKGLWQCFGCGQTGDVIDFVRQVKEMSTAAALRYLAQRRDRRFLKERAS